MNDKLLTVSNLDTVILQLKKRFVIISLVIRLNF